MLFFSIFNPILYTLFHIFICIIYAINIKIPALSTSDTYSDILRLVYKIYSYSYILIFLTPTDTLVTYSYSVFLTSYIPSYFFIIFLTLPIPLP